MDQLRDRVEPGAGHDGRAEASCCRARRRPPRRGGGRAHRAHELARKPPSDPFEEVQRQNQELLRALDELAQRQEELAALNRELEDTNRGVVALYAELDEKADHLRRADELKSRFLSNMSHEFRTPVNSIQALARLLLERTDGDLTAEQERQVTFIRKAADALSELVNDLLDLAKVEAGKIVVRPVEFDVEQPVRRAARHAAAAARERVGGARLRGAGGHAAAATPTRRRCRRSSATSSRTRSSSPSAARCA